MNGTAGLSFNRVTAATRPTVRGRTLVPGESQPELVPSPQSKMCLCRSVDTRSIRRTVVVSWVPIIVQVQRVTAASVIPIHYESSPRAVLKSIMRCSWNGISPIFLLTAFACISDGNLTGRIRGRHRVVKNTVYGCRLRGLAGKRKREVPRHWLCDDAP